MTSFVRPDTPALIVTAAFRQWKCPATRPISSSLAFPSTGGDFNVATHVPSGVCASEEVLALGFTLIRKTTTPSRAPPGGIIDRLFACGAT